MNNITTQPGFRFDVNASSSSSSTLETTIGILALVLALAAVAVAIVQVYQARAARVHQQDLESHSTIELSRLSSAEETTRRNTSMLPTATSSRRSAASCMIAFVSDADSMLQPQRRHGYAKQRCQPSVTAPCTFLFLAIISSMALLTRRVHRVAGLVSVSWKFEKSIERKDGQIRC